MKIKVIDPTDYKNLVPGSKYYFKHVMEKEFEPGTLVAAWTKILKKYDNKGKLVKEEIAGDHCTYIPDNRTLNYNGEELKVLEHVITCGAFVIGEAK